MRTFEEAAADAAADLLEYHSPLTVIEDTDKHIISSLENEMEELARTHFHQFLDPGRPTSFDKFMLSIGDHGLAMIELRAVVANPVEIVDEIEKLIVRKQHDYGHGNILAFGKKGLIVRLSDKVERYKNLRRRRDESKNESIDDTLQDIVGYSLIGIMLGKGTFQLPLADDLGRTVPDIAGGDVLKDSLGFSYNKALF